MLTADQNQFDAIDTEPILPSFLPSFPLRWVIVTALLLAVSGYDTDLYSDRPLYSVILPIVDLILFIILCIAIVWYWGQKGLKQSDPFDMS